MMIAAYYKRMKTQENQNASVLIPVKNPTAK